MTVMPQRASSDSRRRAERRFGARTVLTFVAVFLVAVPLALLVLMITTNYSPVRHADHDTATTLHSYAVHHRSFTTAMVWVSRAASPLGWWIVLTPVCAWLIYRGSRRLAAFLIVTALGSSVLNFLVKSAVDRARPILVDPVAHASGKSFPSGHTQAATVGCGILVLIFLPLVTRARRRWLWLAAAAVTAVIGFSRIALGVHYLSDVLGGVVLGAAWLAAMTAAFSAWQHDLHRPSGATQGLEPALANALDRQTHTGP